MAAKKKQAPAKSSIIEPKKKAESSLKKQTAVNEITKAKNVMSGLGKGGSGLGRIAYEVSGAGDLKRFVDKPSLGNARNLAFTVAAYAAPGIAKATKSAIASKVASGGSKAVTAKSTAAALKASNATKSIKPLGGTTQVTTRGGGSMAMSNVSKITVKKSPARAAASSRAMSGRAAANKVSTGSKFVAGATAVGKTVSGYDANQQNKKNKKK